MASKLSAAASMQRQSETLRRKLRDLLVEVESHVQAGPRSVVELTQLLARELDAWQTDTNEARAKSNELLKQLAPRAHLETEHFCEHLARDLTTRGHAVFGESSPLIVDGIVHVEINLPKFKATVNRTSVEELAVSSICNAVVAELARLRKVMIPPKQMLDLLARAYDQEIKATGKEPGSQVTAASILLQVALMRQSAAFRSDPHTRNFREYPREQFRADLVSLLEAGQVECGHRRLCFAAGADTAASLFMFVPAFNRAAHLGRLWFEGDER
jgi:hypothetical protein